MGVRFPKFWDGVVTSASRVRYSSSGRLILEAQYILGANISMCLFDDQKTRFGKHQSRICDHHCPPPPKKKADSLRAQNRNVKSLIIKRKLFCPELLSKNSTARHVVHDTCRGKMLTLIVIQDKQILSSHKSKDEAEKWVTFFFKKKKKIHMQHENSPFILLHPHIQI